MSESAKIDLVRKYCGGVGERFAGVVCDFYIQLTGLCKLLEVEKIKIIFLKGRCKPHDHIVKAVKRFLRKYKEMIGSDNLESYTDTISFQVFNRIKEIKLDKGFNLPTLYGYIRKSAYNEVNQQLLSEKILVRRQCGNCVYLSAIKPYKCQCVGNSISGTQNEHYEFERKKIDKACDFFVRKEVELSYDQSENLSKKLENFGNDDLMKETDSKLNYFDLLKLIKKRIDESKSETKKKTLKRHYIVITSLYHYLSYGYDFVKAKEVIAKKIKMNVKTIDRDLKEIRESFKNEFSFA